MGCKGSPKEDLKEARQDLQSCPELEQWDQAFTPHISKHWMWDAPRSRGELGEDSARLGDSVMSHLSCLAPASGGTHFLCLLTRLITTYLGVSQHPEGILCSLVLFLSGLMMREAPLSHSPVTPQDLCVQNHLDIHLAGMSQLMDPNSSDHSTVPY